MESPSYTSPADLRYLIPVLGMALDALEILRGENRPLTLEVICHKSGAPRATLYRIMKTFVQRGYVYESERHAFCYAAGQRKIRFGFGAASRREPSFASDMEQSLRQLALSCGVDLLVLDNGADHYAALRNAYQFVREGVDVVIESEIVPELAPLVAEAVGGAGIPLIAIDVPQDGVTVFGVDHYKAGQDIGRPLARHICRVWDGRFDALVGLTWNERTNSVRNRIRGAFDGIRSVLKVTNHEFRVSTERQNSGADDFWPLNEYFQSHRKGYRSVIVAADDVIALGALITARKLGVERDVALSGFGALEGAVIEIHDAQSAFVCSMLCEISSFGRELIKLGIGLRAGKAVQPYKFVNPKLVESASKSKCQQSSLSAAAIPRSRVAAGSVCPAQ